jgi:hypothetical protein
MTKKENTLRKLKSVSGKAEQGSFNFNKGVIPEPTDEAVGFHEKKYDNTKINQQRAVTEIRRELKTGYFYAKSLNLIDTLALPEDRFQFKDDPICRFRFRFDSRHVSGLRSEFDGDVSWNEYMAITKYIMENSINAPKPSYYNLLVVAFRRIYEKITEELAEAKAISVEEKFKNNAQVKKQAAAQQPIAKAAVLPKPIAKSLKPALAKKLKTQAVQIVTSEKKKAELPNCGVKPKRTIGRQSGTSERDSKGRLLEGTSSAPVSIKDPEVSSLIDAVAPVTVKRALTDIYTNFGKQHGLVLKGFSKTFVSYEWNDPAFTKAKLIRLQIDFPIGENRDDILKVIFFDDLAKKRFTKTIYEIKLTNNLKELLFRVDKNVYNRHDLPFFPPRISILGVVVDDGHKVFGYREMKEVVQNNEDIDLNDTSGDLIVFPKIIFHENVKEYYDSFFGSLIEGYRSVLKQVNEINK